MIRRVSRSLIARLMLSFLLGATIAVILLGYTAYRIGTTLIQESIFQQLSVSANLKEAELNRWIDDQRQEVQVLASSPTIRASATKLINGIKSSNTYTQSYDTLNATLPAIVLNKETLVEIFILSNNGGEIIYSTNRNHEGLFRVSDTYFTLGKRATMVQNVYPSPLTLRPTITIAAPIYDLFGIQVGVIAANLNLDRLDTIINDQSKIGVPTETYLITRYNDFVSSQRFGRSDFPRGVRSLGIERALSGTDGQDLYTNYRNEKVVGVYRWVDQRDLALISEVSQKEAFKPVNGLATYVVLTGALMELVIAVMIYALTRQIMRPVLSLREAAARVAAGDLDVQTSVRSSDEIGELTIAFNRMTEQIRTNQEVLEEQVAQRTADLRSTNNQLEVLAGELREKNTYLEQGLVLAHDIQSSLLPARAPWDANLLLAHARSLPSAEIGGDFYSYVELDRHKVGIAVGDISGKGVAAALMMTLTSGLLEERAREGDLPATVLESVSQRLIERLKANRMNAAVLYLIYDQASSTMRMANAGMITPFLVRDGAVSNIEVVGLPLGTIDAITYHDTQFTVQSNDVLVIISDGVIEAHNETGDMFGFERVEQLMLESTKVDDQTSPVDFMLEQVWAFVGSAKPHDDATIVWLKVP